jgi:hypothetical protein
MPEYVYKPGTKTRILVGGKIFAGLSSPDKAEALQHPAEAPKKTKAVKSEAEGKVVKKAGRPKGSKSGEGEKVVKKAGRPKGSKSGEGEKVAKPKATKSKVEGKVVKKAGRPKGSKSGEGEKVAKPKATKSKVEGKVVRKVAKPKATKPKAQLPSLRDLKLKAQEVDIEIPTDIKGLALKTYLIKEIDKKLSMASTPQTGINKKLSDTPKFFTPRSSTPKSSAKKSQYFDSDLPETPRRGHDYPKSPSEFPKEKPSTPLYWKPYTTTRRALKWLWTKPEEETSGETESTESGFS